MLFPRLPLRTLLRTLMTLRFRLLLFVVLLLFGASLVIAQPQKPIPTLTSDDVIGAKSATPAVAPPAKEDQKDPSEKAASKDAVAVAPVKSEEGPKKKAEKEWNERLKKAQEKLSELERRADQTELQITQLRNQLFSATARAPEMNGQLNARISELNGLRNRLRAEAQIAQQGVDALQSEGQRNSYNVAGVVLTDEKGGANVQAYQSEYDKLQNELSDAQARVEVLQIRLNSIQSEVLKKGNGDNFTLNRIRQEREQTTADLNDTRNRIEELKSRLQSHRQKAAASGVSLK